MYRILLSLFLTLCLASIASAQNPHENGIQLSSMDGAELDLDAITDGGKNIVLVFWQTWCAPCKREAPGLAKSAIEHGDGIKFVGVVSGSDRDVDEVKIRKYVEKYALPYPQIRDRDLDLAKRYEIKGTPTIIVLGAGLEILYRSNHPPENWDDFDPSIAQGD